jgi:hypothetical protein
MNGLSCCLWLKQINFDQMGKPLQYSTLLAKQYELDQHTPGRDQDKHAGRKNKINT